MEDQDFTEMDRLLNGSLDAELDAAQERELYGRLAMDEELRSSLRDMQAVRSATLNYHGAIAPPAELTRDLFSRLGVSQPPAIPASLAGNAAAPATTPAAGSFLLGLLQHLRALVVGIAVLGGGAALYFTLRTADAPEPSAATQATQPAATHADQPAGIESSRPAAPASTANAATHASAPAATSTSAPAATSTSASAAANASAPAAANASAPAAQLPVQQSPAAPAAASRAADLAQLAAMPLPVPPLRLPDAGASNDAPSIDAPAGAEPALILRFEDRSASRVLLPAGFAVQYRGYARAVWPAAAVDPKSTPFFRNMALGVRYALGDEHAIGLEIAQEAFPQQYEGTENGARVRIEQQLLTQWLALEYRYRPASLAPFRGARPFLAVNAGATAERWPLLRSTIGLQYSLWRGMTVVLGAEGALLLYPFQSHWNATRSAGVTYGVVMEF